jgi:chorismate dehydratase
MALRIGIVPYLNTYPLVRGLAERIPTAKLIAAPPSQLADALERAEIDLAILSSIFLARNQGFVRVGNACVASRGPIRSVQLFHRVPLREIRRVGLDPASRTSVILGRIILERHLGVAPEYVSLKDSGEFPTAGFDAAVMIGDRSFDLLDEGVPALDLGQAWRDFAGLPFVFALWTGRADRDWRDVACLLEEVRDRNIADPGTIAREASGKWGRSVGFCEQYFSENVRYFFGTQEQAGLERFFAEAEAYLGSS